MCVGEGEGPCPISACCAFTQRQTNALPSETGQPGLLPPPHPPPLSYDEHHIHPLVAKGSGTTALDSMLALPPGFWLGLATGVAATSVSLAMAAAVHSRRRV